MKIKICSMKSEISLFSNSVLFHDSAFKWKVYEKLRLYFIKSKLRKKRKVSFHIKLIFYPFVLNEKYTYSK